jgi:hypothetical protein
MGCSWRVHYAICFVNSQLMLQVLQVGIDLGPMSGQAAAGSVPGSDAGSRKAGARARVRVKGNLRSPEVQAPPAKKPKVMQGSCTCKACGAESEAPELL